jgi:hypothetical protein
MSSALASRRLAAIGTQHLHHLAVAARIARSATGPRNPSSVLLLPPCVPPRHSILARVSGFQSAVSGSETAKEGIGTRPQQPSNVAAAIKTICGRQLPAKKISRRSGRVDSVDAYLT